MDDEHDFTKLLTHLIRLFPFLAGGLLNVTALPLLILVVALKLIKPKEPS